MGLPCFQPSATALCWLGRAGPSQLVLGGPGCLLVLGKKEVLERWGPVEPPCSFQHLWLLLLFLIWFWLLLEAAIDHLMTPGEIILSPLSQEEEMGVGSRGETCFLRNCCPRDAGSCALGCPRASCSLGTGICKVSSYFRQLQSGLRRGALAGKGVGDYFLCLLNPVYVGCHGRLPGPRFCGGFQLVLTGASRTKLVPLGMLAEAPRACGYATLPTPTLQANLPHLSSDLKTD